MNNLEVRRRQNRRERHNNDIQNEQQVNEQRVERPPQIPQNNRTGQNVDTLRSEDTTSL